jgi:uncharacterized damage-inducible protein DinB
VERLEAIEGNCHFLAQGIEVLRRMQDDTYSNARARAGTSPVGTHFRHVFDHYHAFLSGLAEGRIDYDDRRRDPRLERERCFAIETAIGLMTDLARLPGTLAGRALEISVRSEAGHDGEPDWSGSTVKRELQFLVSHTVHHYALIKEVLRQSGFETGEEFGVAPSTLAHQSRQAACAL